MVQVTSVAAIMALSQAAQAGQLQERLDNGLGLTPTMGWSSWNVGQCAAASASYALDTANKFVSLGLKDLGYTNVNIDDCWDLKERDSSGNLQPDPSKWPNGIRPVVEQIHGMGLKFGLYGCAGTMTCGGYPGSQGHETQDAALLASWDVDFWKHDNCYTPCYDSPLPQTCGNPNGSTKTWYKTMHDAFEDVKGTKNIFFNLCQWGRESVWTWGADYGNSWRMSEDNWGDWASVVRIGSAAASIAQYAAPGGFNDLDMLIVGNGALTENEERLHFGLWAICKSPLILGTNLDTISSSTLAIVSNKGIIDINQDKFGLAASTFTPSGKAGPVSGQIYPYWSGPVTDGYVIGLAAANGAATLSINFADVPDLGAGPYTWTEYYSGQTGNGTSVSFDLGTHDMAVIKVDKPGGQGGTTSCTKPTGGGGTSSGDGGASCSAMYGQCGGSGYSGPTCCSSGTCKYSNDWYSQCL